MYVPIQMFNILSKLQIVFLLLLPCLRQAGEDKKKQ
jgi:hypothetical protein